MKLFLASTTTALALAGSVTAGSFTLDQGYDGINGLTSTSNSPNEGFGDSRTADDFTLTQQTTDFLFQFDMGMRFQLFQNFMLEIRTDNGGSPDTFGNAPLFVHVGADNVQSTGESLLGQFEVFSVQFDLSDTGLTLDPGTYWVSPVGISDGSGNESQTFWATGGSGNGADGNFASDWFGFPAWTATSDATLLGTSHDFAMTIRGTTVPAPASLVLMGIWILPHRRRRGA